MRDIVKTVSKDVNVTITKDQLIGLAQLAAATKKDSRRLHYTFDAEKWIWQLYRETMLGDWELSGEDRDYLRIST